MEIDKIRIYLAAFPLEDPYELSFGKIESFKSIFVKVSAGGKVGWGESTPLFGYTQDSANSVYERTESLSCGILNKELEIAMESVMRESGFSGSALSVALEMLSGKVSWSGLTREVPLVYLIKSTAMAAIKDEVAMAHDEGYRSFKCKIGIDACEDAKRANFILRNLPGDSKARFDANQGYDFSGAVSFLKGLREPEKVELLEQPLNAGDWDNTKRLSGLTDIPIMLDESITAEESISKAAELGCARYIKLKLFKCGSFTKLKALASAGIKNGLKVVLGNGVSTGLGCFLEAKAWTEVGEPKVAGEMNGYLKMKDALVGVIKKSGGSLEYKDVDVSGHIEEPLLEKYAITIKDV